MQVCSFVAFPAHDDEWLAQLMRQSSGKNATTRSKNQYMASVPGVASNGDFVVAWEDDGTAMARTTATRAKVGRAVVDVTGCDPATGNGCYRPWMDGSVIWQFRGAPPPEARSITRKRD